MRLVLLTSLTAALAWTGCGYEGSRPPADAVSEAGPFDQGASTAGPIDEAASVRVGTTGAALRAALDGDYSPDRTPGYDAARDALYAYEQRTHGQFCEVYAGACAALPDGDPSKAAGQIGVNAEHTWPQSYGADDEPLRSDLHHLFPARDVVNSSRGNLPLADVPDDRAEAWYRDRESHSRLPPGADARQWSQRGMGRFEPRDAHKGNAARAVFYVVAVYPEVLVRDGGAAFFETMRASLLHWNRLDPPDDAERARSAWIARLQGTENPFVLDPSLADRAFGEPVSAARPVAPPLATGAPPPPAATPPSGASPPPAPAVWLSALHYDNAGEDRDEGVEIAAPGAAPGTRLDGYTLAFYNGSDGRIYRTVPVSGPLVDGRLWVAVDGIQNGPSDGVAILLPGRDNLGEFWSYEGTIPDIDGRLRGFFREMPVSQDSAPPGTALVRDSPRAPWRVGPHPRR